jgi:HSP20 family protein
MRSGDPFASMWAEARELLERAERLHAHFFEPGRSEAGRPTWQAPVDVFETGEGLTIVVALPGVAPEALEVLLDGQTLIVTGHRPLPARAPGARIQRLEIPWGRFVRRIALPGRDLHVAEQSLAHGCLTLVLRTGRDPR